jgi:hypothetical protein
MFKKNTVNTQADVVVNDITDDIDTVEQTLLAAMARIHNKVWNNSLAKPDEIFAAAGDKGKGIMSAGQRIGQAIALIYADIGQTPPDLSIYDAKRGYMIDEAGVVTLEIENS